MSKETEKEFMAMFSKSIDEPAYKETQEEKMSKFSDSDILQEIFSKKTMNKYQEALEMVRMIAVNGDVMTKEYNGKFMKKMRIIQELVDREVELQSRKNKLVGGSQWECQAKSLAPIASYYIDPMLDRKAIAINKLEIVKVVEIEEHYLKVQFNKMKCFLSTEQFLLCFKPIDWSEKHE